MKKVLIIEDSQIIAEMIFFALEKFNFSMEKFDNVNSITPEQLNEADVIILDHFLGIENGKSKTGFDLIHKVTLSSEVIVISGQTDPNIAIEYIEQGALAYINKDQLDFIEKLQAIMEQLSEDCSPLKRRAIQKEMLQNIDSLFD